MVELSVAVAALVPVVPTDNAGFDGDVVVGGVVGAVGLGGSVEGGVAGVGAAVEPGRVGDGVDVVPGVMPIDGVDPTAPGAAVPPMTGLARRNSVTPGVPSLTLVDELGGEAALCTHPETITTFGSGDCAAGVCATTFTVSAAAAKSRTGPNDSIHEITPV